jgi:hypothetical protein
VLTHGYYIQDHVAPMFPHPSSPDSDSVQKPDADPTPPISRRDFGRRAAVAAVVTLSSSMMLACNTSSVQEAKPGEKSPGQNGGGLTPDQSQEVEARLANIVRKYGNRLSNEQRQHLRRILTYNERMLVSIRTFSLQNGDAPASVLKISFTDRAEPAKPMSSTAGQSSRGSVGTEKHRV